MNLSLLFLDEAVQKRDTFVRSKSTMYKAKVLNKKERLSVQVKS